MESRPLTAIIADAQRGEAAAFEELVDLYGSRLHGFFYRLSGHCGEAEDLTQDVFVRVVRMIALYKDDGRFEAWLFRIAANLARDRVRSARRAPSRITVDGDDDPLLDMVDSGDAPDLSLGRGEDIDRLNAAIAELPVAEREVILLRHFSQLSFKEIAEMLRIPIGTALARTHRGLQHLRKIMEALESGDDGNAAKAADCHAEC